MIRINESTREMAIACAEQIAADPSTWLRRIANAIEADTTSKDLYVEILGIAVGIQNERFKRHPTNDIDCLIVKLQAEDGRPAVKIVEHFHDTGRLSSVRFNFGDDYKSTLLALQRSYGIDSVAIAYDPQNVMGESQINEGRINIPADSVRSWKFKLWNGHGFLTYNFDDGIWFVDSDGIPAAVYSNEEELYSRDLYVGDYISVDRIRELNTNKLRYFATLNDFDMENYGNGDAYGRRLTVNVDIPSETVTLTPRR